MWKKLTFKYLILSGISFSEKVKLKCFTFGVNWPKMAQKSPMLHYSAH